MLSLLTFLLISTFIAPSWCTIKAHCVARDIGRISCYDISANSNYTVLSKELDESRQLPDVSLEIYRSAVLQIPLNILKDRHIWKLVLNGNTLLEVPTTFLKSIGASLTELYLANNAITSITKQNFKTYAFNKNLLSLDLSGNALKTLEPFSFSELVNLRLLDLKKNALTSIATNTFQGLQSLTSLYLQYNKIQDLQPHSFPNLTKLVILDLEHNRILTLKRGVFNDMMNLKNVTFSGNIIREIEPFTFVNATKLTWLSLAHNQLRHLENGTFAGLENNYFIMLELKENPFHCLCKLQWLQDWINKRFMENRIDAKCKLPYPALFPQVNFCLVPN